MPSLTILCHSNIEDIVQLIEKRDMPRYAREISEVVSVGLILSLKAL